MKKIVPGCYEYTTPEGLTFRVVQIRDADTGSGANGKWYFDGGENEGGNDHFNTKRAAIAALHDYIAHRQYVSPYGWCYCP